MSYLGDFVGTETIPILFTTVQATGAPTTLAGTPKLRVYKAGGTTESSDITPTVDFDSRTGLNLCSIDLTGDSGFYATGNDFTVVITAGTVNSVSVVGYVVAEFSILKRSPLRPATAGRTLVVDASGLADANVVRLGPTGSGTAQTARDVGASVLLSPGTGTGQLDFTSGVVKANLAQILGTALTETAGLLAGGFKKFFNIATPASTMDVLARVTLTDAATNLTNAPTNGDLTAAMKASVNAEALDVLNVDTYAEPGQEAPGATITLAKKISYLYKMFRNKKTQTATTFSLFADDASTVDQKATVSDDATTATRGEIATGP